MDIPTTIDNRRDPVMHLKIEQTMVTEVAPGVLCKLERVISSGQGRFKVAQ